MSAPPFPSRASVRLRLTRSIVVLVGAAAIAATQAVVPFSAASAQARPAGAPAPAPSGAPTASPATPPPLTAKPRAQAQDPQAAVDAVRRKAKQSPAPEVKTGSHQISPAAAAFLDTGLGLPSGGSQLLTGLRAPGDLLKVATGAPTPSLPLPAEIKAPSFAPATLVVDTAADTITVTSEAADAELSVTIAHASTTTLAGEDLKSRVRVTVPVLGERVRLTGEISGPTGRVTLAGPLPENADLGTGTAQLAKGAVVTLTTDDGLRVSGPALIGPSGHRLRVNASGELKAAGTWSLSLDALKQGEDGPAIVPGLTLAGKVTGTVTVTDGSARFEAHARTSGTWTLADGVSVSGATVEFADTPPQGADVVAPGVVPGTPWLAVTGDISLPGGDGGTIAARGTVAVNLADGTAILTGRQEGSLTLATAPMELALGQTGFLGTLKVGRTDITGTIRGTGVVTGAETTVQADVRVTDSGRSVAAFSFDRSRLGMGATSGNDLVYWASDAVPGFADGSGTQIDLPAGFSTRSAVQADAAAPAVASPSATPSAAPVAAPLTAAPSKAAPSKAAPTASVAAALGADAVTTDPSPTYTLSTGVRDFIAGKLGIPVASTVSGTLSGQTLTVQLTPPGNLPITLPAGVAAPVFGPTTLTIDESTGTLSLNASATSGVTATLQVTIAHAATSTLATAADLTATLTLGNVPLISGATATLQGTLAYTGGTLSASLSGTLTSALPVTTGFVIQPGATLTLATGTGLTLSAAAQVGTGDKTFVVQVDGAFADLNNWSLAVSNASAPVWQPLPSLTVVPAFTGSVTSEAGVIGFDLATAGDEAPITWTPSSGATLLVTSLHVSNQAPPKDLVCPSGITEGAVWMDAKGQFDYTPADLKLNAESCVNLSGKSFTIGTTATGELLPDNPTFQLTKAGLSVTGHAQGNSLSVTVTGNADLQVTGPTGDVSDISAAVSFGADGLIAAGTITDLSKLGSGMSGTGTVYVSSREVANFRPADLGLPGEAFPATIRLEPGVTVSYAGALPDGVTRAFGKIGVPMPATKVLAVATVATSGISAALDLHFDNGGLKVFDSPKGASFYFDDLTFGFSLGANTGVSMSGAGRLHMPVMAPGGSPSDATLVVSGSLQVSPPSMSVSIGLSNWSSAFGVKDLSVSNLAGKVSVSATTVALGFSADGVVLPDSWGTAIGLVPGAKTSLDVNVDLNQPVISVAIEGVPVGGAPGPALTPLAARYASKIKNGTLTQSDRDVINSVVVNKAAFYLAPFGGVTAAGQTIRPGLGVSFDATVDHVAVKVEGAVTAVPPSIDVDVSVGAYPIGPVQMNDTHFFLNASPTSLKLGFKGGFNYRGNSFKGSVELALGTTANGATVSLSLESGLPSYLEVDTSFVGSVSGDSGGAQISAYGYGSFKAGGQSFGTVSYSLNIPGNLSWNDVVDSATSIVNFLLNHGLTYDQVIQILKEFGYSQYDILNTFGGLGAYGNWLINQVASHFPFTNNYYDIWVGTSSGQLLVLDVAGESQSPNASVITYSWNGHYNQDWAFVQSPVFPGWYEIVNRNSGQCLSVLNDSTAAGTPLVQYPCFGGYNQLWGMGSIGLNTTYSIRSLRNNLYIDVNGGYQWSGGTIDQWYWNGNWNQRFWLTNAA